MSQRYLHFGPLAREFYNPLGPSLAFLRLPKGFRVLRTTLEHFAPIRMCNQDVILVGRHTLHHLMIQRQRRIAATTPRLCP